MPDVTILGDRDLVQPFFSDETAIAGSSEVLDRCYTGTGRRHVLRFNSYIGNIGTADLNAGRKTDHPTVWTASPAFGGSLRFEGWSRFFLLKNGDAVAYGHKSSFCMVDLHQIDPAVPGSGRGCEYLTAGWADIYSSGLDCQFIDVTDVEPGTYTLRIEGNFDRQLPDSDISNNFAELEVEIQ
jgi:hypothetical protein